MALKKSNIQVTVSIDGIDLTYNTTQSEAELLQKAEELINKEIETFRNTYRSPDYNKMLISLMMKFVMEILRKESDAEDAVSSLKEINSQLAEYLRLSKMNA